MTAFRQALAVVVGHEGGLDLNPADPGNWTGGQIGAGRCAGTKFGISAQSYPELAIAELTEDAAAAIYRRDFWDRIAGDTLPPPLALLVFDAAVNNGVSRAVRWLQQVVGVAPDGLLGPVTLAAIAAAAPRGTGPCAEFTALRIAFMAGLPGWRLFGLGWARRLAALPYESLTMTAE